MTEILIPTLGVLAAFLGATFLIGCFTRVDSPRFVERAGGSPERIGKLQSLQDAWSKLGRVGQFFASSAALLIVGLALLSVWASPGLAKYYWAVPVVLTVNLVAVLLVLRRARHVLDPSLPGHADVLKVIKQNIRMCVTFSVVFVLLVAGPN